MRKTFIAQQFTVSVETVVFFKKKNLKINSETGNSIFLRKKTTLCF